MDRGQQLHELLDELLADDTVPSTLAEAAELAGLIERASRKLDAAAIRVVDHVDRAGLQTADGHTSVTAWAAFTCRTSRREAARRVQAARMFRKLTTTASAYAAGDVGRDQVADLARAFRNPRCGDQLADSEMLLLEDAQSLDQPSFEKCVKRWIQLADRDGARQRHDTLHENRDARCTSQFDGGFRFEACLGPLQGETVKNLFEGFLNAQRLADWDTAKAEHGETAAAANLARTEAQRRADAFVAAMTQAASVAPGATAPEPSAYVLFSSEAFELAINELAGLPLTPLDPRNYRNWRCETSSGVPIDPSHALALALGGYLRRIVLSAPDATISQKVRLFTGPVRELLNIRDTTCTWPGCGIESRFCQADHTIPYRQSRRTTPSNGNPKCGHHNRFKERGYHTWRDPDGTWHVQRPDGTRIEPAA